MPVASTPLRCLAPLALSLACATAAAQAPAATDLARLDGFALGLEAAGRFSGVVLVAHDGQVVFEKAYGLRDETGEAPLRADDRLNLASAGKMFTSVAILQQVAAGRITLDSHVGEVLEDYPNRAFADTVTVRQLLTHTAGAGDVDELFGAAHAAERARLRSAADIIALHGRRAPQFAPGTQQKYGNYGYVVLGRMVEVLSGQDFESYVRAHVLAPAGMTRTGFVDCDDPAPDLAAGYAEVEGRRVRNCATLPARGFAAGGQVAPASDLLRFVQALVDGRLLVQAGDHTAARVHGAGLLRHGLRPGRARTRLPLGAWRQRRRHLHRRAHLPAYRRNRDRSVQQGRAGLLRGIQPAACAVEGRALTTAPPGDRLE